MKIRYPEVENERIVFTPIRQDIDLMYAQDSYLTDTSDILTLLYKGYLTKQFIGVGLQVITDLIFFKMKRLYYFTSLEHLDCILQTGIKTSSLESVNDPYEISAIRVGENNVEELISLIDYPDWFRYRFICMSRSYSNPVMWGNYANKHNGVCLGVDIARDSEFLYCVEYSQSILRLGKETPNNPMDILAHKYSGWSFEEEERFYTNKIHENFSEEFKLQELIFGMKVDLFVARKYRSFKYKTYKMKMNDSQFRMDKVEVL